MRWLRVSRSLRLLALAFFVASTSSEVTAATRTETFDTGLGNFSAVNGNTSNGNNFAWSNTANATNPDAPGEVGGTFARTAGINNAYIADANLGGVLSQGQDLVISGTVSLQNINWNAAAFVGFFNTADSSNLSFLGMLIEEPDSSAPNNLRIFTNVNDQHAVKQSLGFQNTPISFSLVWDANPSGDGSGTLSGTTSSLAGNFILNPTTVGPGTWNYNAFGVGAGAVGSSDPNVRVNAWFDNLTYSIVPEPTGVTLFVLGIGTIFTRRRRSNSISL